MDNTGDCYVGDQKVPCPQNSTGTTTQTVEKLDILPYFQPLDKRNDLLFTLLFSIVVIGFLFLAVIKTKIFGKTLGEYIRPIWYFILIATVVVAWQYLVGVNLNASSIQLRVSQWIWEAVVALSAYKLSKIQGISYGNMFFLAIIYSFFIHGLKVSARYFFYEKTLLYCLDRFVYGSLLVMVFAFLVGSTFVYLKQKSS